MEKNPYTKEQIKNIASDILKCFWKVDDYPVRVDQLAKEMGLKVCLAAFERDDVSGMLEANRKIIYICKSDSLVRQRFSVAHEIGHYVLHYKGKRFEDKDNEKHISFRDNFSSLGFSIKEIEANFFAANILMPEKKVFELRKKDYDLQKMADFFKVSIAAMTHRLNFLGLLDCE